MDRELNTPYDAVIAGGGHNGLVAACYLALAGKRVLVLEKNAVMGGATRSERAFPAYDARLSVYSYLVSLLPAKILSDLGLKLELRRRATASFTPAPRGSLRISNLSEDETRASFLAFCGNEREYQGYRSLDEKVTRFAEIVWPTLIRPLLTRQELRDRFASPEDRRIWDYLVERPLAAFIEDHLSDDVVRGAVFTDAKIGVSTWPEDPSLLQNRTYLYHVIGQGTGEWRVPVGGMGALLDSLLARARGLGVELRTRAEVTAVHPGEPGQSHTVVYRQNEQETSIAAEWVLFNAASNVLNACLPGAYQEEQVPGSVFKMNMLFRRLPTPRDPGVSPREAFSGTFHINESYEHMKTNHRDSLVGAIPTQPSGEMYCHSLTDDSILAPDLRAQGFHTLTLFGLDVPYSWFPGRNDQMRDLLVERYLEAVNAHLREDVRDCLARNPDGSLCVQAMTPLDLEKELGLPRGNIFHGNLTWPFAEEPERAGTWGVETNYARVLLCGSSALRGGAVSGIPGHNAAMKILGINPSR